LNQEIYIAYIFGLWSLTTLSTIFQLYRDSQFYWWRKTRLILVHKCNITNKTKTTIT